MHRVAQHIYFAFGSACNTELNNKQSKTFVGSSTVEHVILQPINENVHIARKRKPIINLGSRISFNISKGSKGSSLIIMDNEMVVLVAIVVEREQMTMHCWDILNLLHHITCT